MQEKANEFMDRKFGTKSTKRGFRCINCGKRIMMNRRQRHSRFRMICPNCGRNSFEICKTSRLNTEIKFLDEIKSHHKEIGSIMKR